MTSPDPDPNQNAGHRPPDHQAPDPLRRHSDTEMRVWGAALAAAAIFGVELLYIVSNIPRIGGTPPRVLATQSNWELPLSVAIAALTVLTAIAWRQWTRRRSSAFAAGLLIGLGIAALIEGICFASMR